MLSFSSTLCLLALIAAALAMVDDRCIVSPEKANAINHAMRKCPIVDGGLVLALENGIYEERLVVPSGVKRLVLEPKEANSTDVAIRGSMHDLEGLEAFYSFGIRWILKPQFWMQAPLALQYAEMVDNIFDYEEPEAAIHLNTERSPIIRGNEVRLSARVGIKMESTKEQEDISGLEYHLQNLVVVDEVEEQ
jgi:hypothetical protein